MMSMSNDYHDEDLPKMSRKPREKKPIYKFSLLYTIPISVLNEGKGRGKRQGFVTYDSLVCKTCKPNRFFHSRSALKLHSSEDHDGSSRVMSRMSVPRNTNNRSKPSRSRRNKTVECIDLDSDDSESEDDDGIEILEPGAEIDLSLFELALTNDKEANSSNDDSGIDIEYVDEEETVEITPLNAVIDDDEVIGVEVEKVGSPTSDDSGIECVDIFEANSDMVAGNFLEVTLEEEGEGQAHDGPAVVDMEEVDAENSHIRNLLKEFDQSPINKRKQDGQHEVSKKACLDDEALLMESTPKSKGSMVISSTFTISNESLDDDDDDIYIC